MHDQNEWGGNKKGGAMLQYRNIAIIAACRRGGQPVCRSSIRSKRLMMPRSSRGEKK